MFWHVSVHPSIHLSVHRGGGGVPISHNALQHYPEFHTTDGGYPYPIMLCNITQNSMWQVGGVPCWGGTLPGGYPTWGVPYLGGYPATEVPYRGGVPCPGGYPAWGEVPCWGGYPACRGVPCRGGTLPVYIQNISIMTFSVNFYKLVIKCFVDRLFGLRMFLLILNYFASIYFQYKSAGVLFWVRRLNWPWIRHSSVRKVQGKRAFRFSEKTYVDISLWT